MSQNKQIIVPHLKNNNNSLVVEFDLRKTDSKMDFKTEIAHLQSCLISNKDLRDCSEDSFYEAIIQCASLGLSLNPRLGHAYPIPYKINSQKRCSLFVGYKGMMHIVYRANTIKDIQSCLVYSDDPVFEVWTDTSGSQIKHVEARENRGNITHAYCIAHYKNGGHHIEVMDLEDLTRCEQAAKTKYVWQKWRGQMYKKCVTRRSFGQWPKDSEGLIEKTTQILDKFDPIDFTNDSGFTNCVNSTESTLQIESEEDLAEKKFQENFEAWKKLIETGSKTAQEIIDFVQKKGTVLNQNHVKKLMECVKNDNADS